MKKITLTLILLLICIPVFAGVITYKLYSVSYPVLVDGQALQSNLPIMTYQANGGDNTYVPLKAVLNMMGAKTIWNGKAVNITTSQADPSIVANSVVEIFVSKNGKDVGQGSGVIIGYDEIVTNSHVTEVGTSYRIIYNDGSTTQATLVKNNDDKDISILKPTNKTVKPVKLGDSDEINIGQKIFTVSSPKQKRNVITQGKVLRYEDYNFTYGIMVLVDINNGSSGGGVFNTNGELIGIVEAGGTNEGEAFIVLVNDIRRLLAN